MKKTLLVSGCSFTFEPWNWPTPLAEILNMDLINVGMASQGNELIAKKAMYALTELLKTKSSEDMLVGIMWSGIDRHSVYIEDGKLIPNRNTDGWIENPTSVTGKEEDRNWVILNWGWKTPLAKEWYGRFHNTIESVSKTLESILLLQYFLEKNNIDYFMTTYMDIFSGGAKYSMNRDELKYLTDQINWDKFLPTNGEYEWLKENFTEGIPTGHDKDAIHPSEEGHRIFTEECIYPYIKSKIYKKLI